MNLDFSLFYVCHLLFSPWCGGAIRRWVNYGEYRGSLAAFLFTWPNGDTSRPNPVKLAKVSDLSVHRSREVIGSFSRWCNIALSKAFLWYAFKDKCKNIHGSSALNVRFLKRLTLWSFLLRFLSVGGRCRPRPAWQWERPHVWRWGFGDPACRRPKAKKSTGTSF